MVWTRLARLSWAALEALLIAQRSSLMPISVCFWAWTCCDKCGRHPLLRFDMMPQHVGAQGRLLHPSKLLVPGRESVTGALNIIWLLGTMRQAPTRPLV